MTTSGFSVLLRFWAGTAGSIVAGVLAFGLATFDPSRPTIQCITVGLLVAGALTTIRAGYPFGAVALVIVFAVVRLGAARTLGWGTAGHSAAIGLVLGLGVLAIAILYDLLARAGVRIGKFLLVGPLLGGLYVGLAPLMHLSTVAGADPITTWLFDCFLGIVIGDGAALGVELTELLTERTPHEVAEPPQADARGEVA